MSESTLTALTNEEVQAGLSLEQLKQLVGLVEYDATNDPFPVVAQDAVCFVVGNATQAATFYQLAMGMELEAYRGPETGHRESKSYVLRSGSARFVFTGGVMAGSEGSPVLDHHRRHGDGVVDLPIEVTDVDKCVAHARAQGATILVEPPHLRRGGPGPGERLGHRLLGGGGAQPAGHGGAQAPVLARGVELRELLARHVQMTHGRPDPLSPRRRRGAAPGRAPGWPARSRSRSGRWRGRRAPGR